MASAKRTPKGKGKVAAKTAKPGRRPGKGPGKGAGPAKRGNGVPAEVQQGLNSRQLMATTAAREVFWHDVLREMLTSLSMRYEEQSRLAGIVPPGGAIAGPGIPEAENLFDGRIAVINSQGQRIPIAAIVPVLAMGFNGSPQQRALSEAVESTIFQIRTPSGEVFTMPVSEIRSFHAMTEELIQSLERAANEASAEDEMHSEAAGPFGFAAFTSLAKGAADVPIFLPPGSTPPDEGYLPG